MLISPIEQPGFIGTARQPTRNMGFLPKAKVQLLRVAPMGDPIAIRCANSSIALRKNLAKQILVEVSA